MAFALVAPGLQGLSSCVTNPIGRFGGSRGQFPHRVQQLAQLQPGIAASISDSCFSSQHDPFPIR